MHKNVKITIAAIVVVFLIGGGSLVFLRLLPRQATISVPAGLNRLELADLIGDKLRWSRGKKQAFASTYEQIQWDAFKAEAVDIFSEKFSWREAEREVFLTQATRYAKAEFDFLATVYAPGEYSLSSKSSLADIANIFVDRFRKDSGENLKPAIANLLSGVPAEKVARFIRSQVELLPDLVPLPAEDLKIERSNGNTYLLFSTIYFNQGQGPLELRIDETAPHTRTDIERDVFQRIYRIDGNYRDRTAGNFLWHQQHLHYHFADFVVYDLEAVEAPNAPDLSGFRTKSTFCIRDVSNVELEFKNRPAKAKYLICGRKLQGISVGWADTYFYSYADQRLNISDIPSGTYKLSFRVNPSNRFDEISTKNNNSSVLLLINMEKGTVDILKKIPDNLPKVKHIYIDQVFE